MKSNRQILSCKRGNRVHTIHNRLNSASLFFVFFGVFQLVDISAQEALSDSQINERIQYIRRAVKKSEANTNWWWKGWLAGYGSATFIQGAVFFNSKDNDTKKDMVLGVTTNFLAATQLLTQLKPCNKSDILDTISELSDDARLKKLSYAENVLRESAFKIKEGRSWKVHLTCGAVNLCSALITWLGFKHSIWAGIENLTMNTLISETQIWTLPTRILKDDKNYHRKYMTEIEAANSKPRPRSYVGVYPGGIGFRIIF
jgi:hypothetical protein